MSDQRVCQQNENLKDCNCTYPGCSRKGICCECIKHHKELGEIPACLFPEDAEKNYDRSIENFIKVWQEKG